jgi:hypothetical protein
LWEVLAKLCGGCSAAANHSNFDGWTDKRTLKKHQQEEEGKDKKEEEKDDRFLEVFRSVCDCNVRSESSEKNVRKFTKEKIFFSLKISNEKIKNKLFSKIFSQKIPN